MNKTNSTPEGKGGKKEKGLTASIERWRVELSGLIYDMVNHRPSNLPQLHGLTPLFSDIENLIQTEIDRAKSEVIKEMTATMIYTHKPIFDNGYSMGKADAIKEKVSEDVLDMELMWMERTNALVRHMISFCRTLQEKEIHIQKTTKTPIIEMLDQIILELQKHKLPIK